VSTNPHPVNHPEPQTRSSFALLRFISLALVLATIGALAAIAYFTERSISTNREWVIHTYQVRSQLDDLEVELARARASESIHPPSSDDQSPPSQEQFSLVLATIQQLHKLTADNPSQQGRLAHLLALLSPEADALAGKARVPFSATRQTRPIADGGNAEIDAIVRTMKDAEESLLEQRLRDWDYLFKRNVLMLGTAFAVVTVMLAYNFRMAMVEVARTRKTEQQERDNAGSYRQMSARILESQDLERRRIARELHDSVGQYLAGLKINLSQIESGGAFDSKAMIKETIGLTDCALQEVRTLSHLLHPPLLEELGFLPAARWYVDEYGKRGQIQVSLRIEEPIDRLPREIEIALFRVLQESLTNVYRHASARSVHVCIRCVQEIVTLTVADDGVGIRQDILDRFHAGAAAGVGLAGMRERLAEFGGRMTVESSRTGTIIEAVIPTQACRIAG